MSVMRGAYSCGAVRAAKCWPLSAALWLVNGVFGVAFAVASGYWLARALDGSLATRTLLRDLDPDVLIDLYLYHGEGFRMLLVLALFMGAVYAILWCWFHGVVILAVGAGRRADPGETWVRGMEAAPVLAQVLVIAASILVLFSAGLGGAAWLVIRGTLGGPSAMLPYYIGGGSAALWLFGCVYLVAVHDHARIRACLSGQGAFASYGWAWRFVLRGGEKAFRLAVALQVTALALFIAYQWTGAVFQTTAGLGVTGSLLWGQAYMFARMLMRVWFFAAQSELHV